MNLTESQLPEQGRPLIGNSVLRIWRDTRLPYALAKTQSPRWDILPTPEGSVMPAVTSTLTHADSQDGHTHDSAPSESHTGDVGQSASEDENKNEEDSLQAFDNSDDE
jgi:hypothetical protein